MAAINHFNKNEKLSGICNPAITDSSANLNTENLSSNVDTNQINELINLNSNIETNRAQNDQAIDIVLQNYIYDFKTFSEDTKSNKSVMTSKSTREIFDLLSRLLPIGIVLLIVFLMIHFVFYVRDIEPYKSISEIICKALAATVIPLSIVFILRIVCDCNRRNSTWNGLANPYSTEEYVYTPNNNYGYNENVLEQNISHPVITNLTIQPKINQNSRQFYVNNQQSFSNLDFNLDSNLNKSNINLKQPHFYIDPSGNRIYATQLAGLEFKKKNYTHLDNFNKTDTLDPKTDKKSKNSFKQYQQNPQAINMNNKKIENLINETST